MIGIYKIVSPNGKVYVGQTRNHRLRINCYSSGSCKSQTKLYNSIVKYGWDTHLFQMIEECSIEMLNEREIHWGNLLNCLDREKGLNCRLGGQNTQVSDETRKRLSEGHKGRKPWNKGLKYNEEQKKNIKMPDSKKQGKFLSELYKGKSLEERVGGKERSDEVRENMRKGMLGKNTSSIICITTGEKFNSIKEASEKFNVHENSIGNILNGLARKTRKGLTFIYA